MKKQINKNPLISIIVPIYKVEKYLDKCIDSIINQTYTNLEIILVDDGSPDNCPKMCDNWAKKDKRIKVIHKQNGGLSEARNYGIENSKGEFISFVDSDDYLNVNFIETLYNDLIKTKSDMSIVDYQKVNESDNINIKQIDKKTSVCCYENNDKYYCIYKNNSVAFVVAWNKLYKKSIFIENNIRYPVGKINEDEFVVHKIMLACKKICFRDAKYYYYLQRNNSIMHQNYTEKNLQVYDGLFERLEFFTTFDEKLFLIGLKHLLYTLMSKYAIQKPIRKQLLNIFNETLIKYKKEIKKLSIKQKLKIVFFKYCRFPIVLYYLIKEK